MAITIPILTQFKGQGLTQAINEIKRAQGAFGKFAASGKLFQSVGTSLTKNLTAPILAAGGAIGFFIKEAIDAEAATSRLRQILITTGGATEKGVEALLNQASALEKVGIASKESIVTTQAQLATFDLQGTTISNLTPAILDYVLAEKGASATTEDFKSMTNGLAQALNGQFGSLTRAGFVLDEDTKKKIANGTESERAAALVQVLNSTYEGFNESLARTPEGRIILLQREFGALRQELGSVFLPVALQISDVIKDRVIPEVQKLVDKFKALSPETINTGLKVLGFIAVLGPLLYAVGKIIIAIASFRKAMLLLNLTMAANPILLAVMAVTALIAIFVVAYKSNERFRIGVNKIANAIIAFVEGAVNYAIFYLNLYVKAFNLVIRGANLFGANLTEIGELSNVTFKRLNTVAKATKEVGEEATDSADAILDDYVPAMGDMGVAAGEVKDQTDKATAATKRLNAEMKKTLTAARDAAQVIVDDLEKALDNATRTLDDAKDAFNSFKDTIKGTVTSILNFGRAVETGDFLSGLVAQAADATVFADKIRKLIELGLSERALRQVLDAGFEAGSVIADNIIAGGSTVVQQVNALVDSVAQVADQVGEFGARTFYQAGITQGEALVAGIRAALDQAQAELNSRIAALTRFEETTATSGASAGTPTTGGSPTQLLPKTPKLDLSRLTPKSVQKISALPSAAARSYTALAQAFGITKFAEGGIVNKPMMGLVGEAGPEAIIPLSGRNSGLGNTFNITVNAGIGTDGAAVGRVIVDAIKKFERTSGPVFASA